MKTIKNSIKKLKPEPKFKRNRKVTRFIYFFLWSDDTTDSFTSFSNYPKITDIKTRVIKGTLEIQIVCFRPGLLIGKAGSNINRLKQKLIEHLNCPIKIIVKENNLWNYPHPKYEEQDI